MARYSPEVLRSIRGFSPSSAGMLTGAQNPTTAAGADLARGVGTLFGRDMRSTQEKARAELQGIDPKDPNAQIKSLEIVAKYGTPEQIANALGKIQEIQAGRQAAAQELAAKQAEAQE